MPSGQEEGWMTCQAIPILVCMSARSPSMSITEAVELTNLRTVLVSEDSLRVEHPSSEQSRSGLVKVRVRR